MLRKMLSWGSRPIDLTAGNENAPAIATAPQAAAPPDNVRALAATVAASLAASRATCHRRPCWRRTASTTMRIATSRPRPASSTRAGHPRSTAQGGSTQPASAPRYCAPPAGPSAASKSGYSATSPPLHEQEALADLAQDLELERRRRVQAHEHQPALAAQPAEEIQHEADVAVLGVELRLVEQVHQRIGAARRLQQERRLGLA